MIRPLRVFSIAFLTAGPILFADIGVTLLYREPLSSLYAAVKQSEAASQLSEVESRYPSAADRRAIAAVRGERERISVLARRFAVRTRDGESIGRIRAPAMR